VLAIVLQAVVRVGQRALTCRITQSIAAASFVAIFFFDIPFPLIIIAAATTGFLGV
jgi:chromate transporter